MTLPGCMAGAGVVLLLGWMALRVAAGMPDVLGQYEVELAKTRAAIVPISEGGVR